MFSTGNWPRKSLFSGNNECVIPTQICKLKLEVIRPKVMKRRKAEYFLNDFQRKCLHVFGWIFLCCLEGCDSINIL